MNNVFDTKERIARSNIYSIFGEFIRRQIDNNDDGEVLLKGWSIRFLGRLQK